MMNNTVEMESDDNMNTLSEVMEKLRRKKTDLEFTWENGHFTGLNGRTYSPEELTIVKTYRFEGDSNPDDSSVLYIIRTNDGVTGYRVDAYGMYSSQQNGGDYDNFFRLIKLSDRKDQLLFEI